MPQISELWSGVLKESGRKEQYTRLVDEVDRKIGSFLSFDPDNPD